MSDVRRAYRVSDVRAAEALLLAAVPEGALMQRAAAGLAACCAGLLRRRRGRVSGAQVWLLVGRGNNGGDALWAGERLARRGARVSALLLAPQVHAEGLAGLRAAGGRVVEVGAVPSWSATTAGGAAAVPDLVIDGLVGLGGAAGLREPAASVVAGLPPGVAVVAVDLPSGVDPDSGETPAAHVRADLTVTFGAAKPCLLLPPGCRDAGEVVEVDLGLQLMPVARPAVERLTARAAGRLWPVPGAADDKYSRGVVGVVAGSSAYTGAAVLACAGALRAGAGMVRYLGPAHPADLVRAAWPEVVVGEGRVQAWVLGSGVDPHAGDGQADAVRRALAQGLPCVVDAGALALLTGPEQSRARLGAHVLLTPHAGELAALLQAWEAPAGPDGATRGPHPQDVRARPLHFATRAAELTGATVLLKGSTTIVAHPDGRVRSQGEGPPWLATAGAGDVLAGVAGALLAAGLDPLDAGSVAAVVHGLAARAASAGGPLLAQDVAAALPATIAACIAERTVGGV